MTHPKNLGPPSQHVLERDGDLPLVFTGWEIGAGRTPGSHGRCTEVRIYRTVAGNLIAHVDQWQRLDDGINQGPRTCSPPTTNTSELLAWLKRDNHGKLGPASRQAWEAACGAFPEPGEAVEVVS